MLRPVAAALLFFVGLVPVAAIADPPRPNIVIIFADDQGYGDLGCFGSETIKTPHIDRLAAEGRRFTSFMVASSVCTPSRAALLTGCYPKRVGLHKHVLFPQSNQGLHPNEHTIADQLKSLGYATACFGKWHLGHHAETLPRQQGFDTYLGVPYSNDMNHPDNKAKPRGSMADLWSDQASCLTKWNTPLVENEEIVELPVDQRTLTRRYTDRAIDFVKAHQNEPFFVYLPHSMPHIPLYVPEDAYDPDPNRAYDCVIEHIDTEVGRLIDTIRQCGIAENTIVIYTSDNGPWLPFKSFGGTAGPLRGGKSQTFEGGQRVPCVVWAPGRVPAGTECHELVASLDLLPTIAALTDSTLPADRPIDGLDVSGLLTGTATESPRNEFVYYAARGEVEGIRRGDWKLLLIPPSNNSEGETMLFDLARDVGEQSNVAAEHPDVVAELTTRMRQLDSEITNNARPTWVKPAK
jgi:arylsulfatase A-like enzyme